MSFGDTHDSRFTLRYIMNDDMLVLESATDDFLRLLSLDKTVMGKPVESVFPLSISDCLYHILGYLKRSRQNIVIFKELENNFIAARIFYQDPIMSVNVYSPPNHRQMGRLYSECNLSIIPINRFFDLPCRPLLLEKTGDSFTICSIDADSSELFGVNQGDDVCLLLNKFCCLKSGLIFNWCLREKRFLLFADIFNNNLSASYYILGIAPINNEQKHVLFSLHMVDEAEYFRLISTRTIEDDILSRYLDIGAALYRIDMNRVPILVKSNKPFDSFVSTDSELYFIHNSLIMQSCLRHTTVSVPRTFGGVECISIAVPSPVDNSVFAFIIPVAATSASSAFADKRLTRRENEIAQLVSMGNSIRSIASNCGISEGTVKKTLSNIYSKLNINSRSELIRIILLRSGLPDR